VDPDLTIVRKISIEYISCVAGKINVQYISSANVNYINTVEDGGTSFAKRIDETRVSKNSIISLKGV
jgi:hypothetical protein